MEGSHYLKFVVDWFTIFSFTATYCFILSELSFLLHESFLIVWKAFFLVFGLSY